MKKILFVCTGNTCRSPMATAVFNHLIPLVQTEPQYTSLSAGLAVPGYAPPSTNALLAVKYYLDVDISGHRARLLTLADIEEAFLVLTMTMSHKQYILSMFPNARQKIFTLKEYAYDTLQEQGKSGTADILGFSPDVADPYGGSIWIYKKCFREIARAVEKLIEKLTTLE